MDEEKQEKTIKIECLMCNVSVDIPLSDMRIISTDQGAGFIRNPQWICENCGSVCTVTLPGADRIKKEFGIDW